MAIRKCSGVVTADLVIEELLRTVLAQLSNDPSVIEELFKSFVQEPLADAYGQKTIDDIKTYLTTNKIHVIDGYSLLNSKIPAYVVHLGGSQELDQEATLDDFGHEEYIDDDGEPIQAFGSQISTTSLEISAGKRDVFTSSIREQVIIDCIAQDKPLIARFLAYLLHYILRLNKDLLIEQGLNRISIAFSDFHPLEEHARLPDYLFRRVCTVSCQHYLNIDQDVTDKMVDALCVKIQAQLEGTTDEGDTENDIVTTIK